MPAKKLQIVKRVNLFWMTAFVAVIRKTILTFSSHFCHSEERSDEESFLFTTEVRRSFAYAQDDMGRNPFSASTHMLSPFVILRNEVTKNLFANESA